jgi:hypothetical protein
MNGLVANMSVSRSRMLPQISANIGNSAPMPAMTPARGRPAAMPMMAGTPQAMAKRIPSTQCNCVACSGLTGFQLVEMNHARNYGVDR